MAEPALPGIPAGSRLVVIPDTDGDLPHTLAVLEEILLQLQPYYDDEPAAEGAETPELHKPGPCPPRRQTGHVQLSALALRHPPHRGPGPRRQNHPRPGPRPSHPRRVRLPGPPGVQPT